ncbi:MAG: serine/threonine-protein kinase [Gammaproteobacteria bacterium]|nr:serine/threonine-protein kinase [Gammaproteobacteria bacterium]
MPDLDQSLKRGYLLEGYRVEQVIGGGGFSFVYLAYHIKTQSKVVIKEYFPHELVVRIPGGRIRPRSDVARNHFQLGMKRFFSEGMALAKLKHPNIINVSNFFRANDTVFMVMDFEEGRDLRFFIKKARGKLSEKFMLSVFPPIMSGLKELHDRHFLHLDIKPANILLRASGVPLLLDFGAVQQVEPGSTYHGVQTLTHGYAAPEQYSEGGMGPWCDIYSLGMTMRICITGKGPPSSPERLEKDTLQPLTRTLSRRYSRNLLEAIDWATELNQDKRARTIDELLVKMTGGSGLATDDAAGGWFQ